MESSTPVSACDKGSIVGMFMLNTVVVSGSAINQAVHASKYTPRCNGVCGGLMSFHLLIRFGIFRFQGKTEKSDTR